MKKFSRGIIVPVMCTAVVPAAIASNPPKAKPNIIFILTDDMGYGDVGCYGGKFVPTPNIDRMAAEGLMFTQYYSASPISSPSRAGLLTGIHPAQWNITSYLQTREGNRNADMADYLNPAAPTLPHALQNAGYKTGHFGKWHLGGGRDVIDAPHITNYGYDEYVSTYESPDPEPLITSTNWIWSDKDSIKRWDRTAYFVDKTLDFLRRNSDKPCFINLWPDDMHTPWVGNIEEQKVFPEGESSEHNFRTVLIEYDRQIGRLLDGLKALGIDKNTIVIFTSDNGPAPSFRGSRAGNYRGCKASLYEGGMRMPFIVWGLNGRVPKGKIDNSTVISALDMYTSLCGIADVKVQTGYKSDGEDLSGALLGKPALRSKPIFFEYRRNDSKAFPKPADKDESPNLAIRNGVWKLLINADETAPALYNLYDDPRETTNLIEQFPDKASELKDKVLKWRAGFPKL
ncbi:MAG: sulfatase-like hydrolase/transferase [Tannerella sp.]|nr:sulfatase-like hydrolase/transferase [Tannerella sp.]